jgi:hypothetical protein
MMAVGAPVHIILSCAGLTRASETAPVSDPRVKPAGDSVFGFSRCAFSAAKASRC